MQEKFYLWTRLGDDGRMADFSDKDAAWAAFKDAILEGRNVYLFEGPALVAYMLNADAHASPQ